MSLTGIGILRNLETVSTTIEVFLPPKYNHGRPVLVRYISYQDCERILKTLSESELKLFLYAKENKRIISRGIQVLEAKKDPLFFKIKSHWETKGFSAGNNFYQDFTNLEIAEIFLSDWTLSEVSNSFYRAMDFVIEQSKKGAPVRHSLLVRTGLIYCPDYQNFLDYQEYVLTKGHDLLKEIVDEGEFRPFDLVQSKKSFDIVYMLTILKHGLKKANDMMFKQVAKHSPNSIDVGHYFKDPYDLPEEQKLEWIFINKAVPRQDVWFRLLIERDEVFLEEIDKISSVFTLRRSEVRKENSWLHEFYWKLVWSKIQEVPRRFVHKIQKRLNAITDFFP